MSNGDYMDKTAPSSQDCVGLTLLTVSYASVLICTIAKLVKVCVLAGSESLLRIKVFYGLISVIAGLRALWLLDFAVDFDREAYAYLNIVPNSLLMLLGSVFSYFWYETITSTAANLTEVEKRKRISALRAAAVAFNVVSTGMQILIVNDYFHEGLGLAPFKPMWKNLYFVYAASALVLSASLYHSGSTLAHRLSAVLSFGHAISRRVTSTQIQALASVAALSFLLKALLPCFLLVIDLSAQDWIWIFFMLVYYGLVEVLPTAYILLVLKASARGSERAELSENELLSSDSNSPLKLFSKEEDLQEAVIPMQQMRLTSV